MNSQNRPILTFAEVDAFDPQGPPSRKWCPLCGENKPKDPAHRSLSLERSSGLWKCFRCGNSGQIKERWPEQVNTSFRERGREMQTAKVRASFALPSSPCSTVSPGAVPSTESSRAEVSKEDVPASVETHTRKLDAQVAQVKMEWEARWEKTEPLPCSPGAAYLKGRGIAEDVATLAGVRWSRNWSGHGAVVFPICDRGGQLVAAQGRAIRGNAKLTAGPKKQGAFFAPVQLSTGKICTPLSSMAPAIILVEAPIDALTLATCGFPTLALCGTSGPDWLHLVCGLRQVWLAFDADEAGEQAAYQFALRFSPFGAQCRRLKPRQTKDWNEELQTVGGEDLTLLLTRALL